MVASSGYYTSHDGLRLAYRSFGEGPATLICVHGLYRNGHDFDVLAEALADRYRVVTPDVVGRGDSDYAPDPARYNTEFYVRDVMGLADHLGLESYACLGTSMGGMIGMALAGKADPRVRRLILNDVGPEIRLATLKEIGQRSVDAPQSFASYEEIRTFFRQALSEWGRLGEAQLERVIRHSVRERDGRWGFRYDRNLIHGFRWPPGDIDLWPLYNAIPCPVLVFWGRKSQVLTADVAAKLRAHANTTLVEVEDAGHAPSLMVPAQIDAVRRFLGEF